MSGANERKAWEPGKKQLTTSDLFDGVKIGNKNGVFISYKDIKLACIVADMHIKEMTAPKK